MGVDPELGPVAISIRREKMSLGSDKRDIAYVYRFIMRTSDVRYVLDRVILPF